MDFRPIETERLLIRRFVTEDWEAVHAYTSDAGVMTYVGDGAETEEQAKAFVAENAGDEARALALVLKEEDRLIGHMLFHPWFTPRVHEIGWVLNPRYHGNGYATEAARALLRYGFETLKVHRMIATCQPENVASSRVMEKIGMRREGHFRSCIPRPDGSWWDEYFYAMLEDDWFCAGASMPAGASAVP
jgi:RimJ/RimL family protein N-acetyltransferase